MGAELSLSGERASAAVVIGPHCWEGAFAVARMGVTMLWLTCEGPGEYGLRDR